jgi:uncharacterized protein
MTVATSGLLALLDDITSLLDDISTMTAAASRKTSAVIGDDLALNAKQLTGISARRELPIVLAVAKGSLVNKAILIPSAIAVSALAPALVHPLLMVGGAYLCFEGAEKLLHHGTRVPQEKPIGVDVSPPALERTRIKSAIRTDFILSAEILIIALGVAAESSLVVQAATLITLGLAMTIFVYGMVLLIVKADDLGLRLIAQERGKIARSIGTAILWVAPRFMRLLSIAGTAAMFLVGGEILLHGIPLAESWIAGIARSVPSTFSGGIKFLASGAAGVTIGMVLAGMSSINPLRRKGGGGPQE